MSDLAVAEDLLILKGKHTVIKDGTDISWKLRKVTNCLMNNAEKNIAIELLKLVLGFDIFHWSLTFHENSAL